MCFGGLTRGGQLAGRVIAALHLAGAGVLLFGPMAIGRALAHIQRFPALPFSLETGRTVAGRVLLVVLLWIGGGTWRRAVTGRLRVDFRTALKSSSVAVVCVFITFFSVIIAVLFRSSLWTFAIWLVWLGIRIGFGRPAYPQALAAHRLLLILGLLLVRFGFGALLEAEKVDTLMAGAAGMMAVQNGLLLLAVSAPMLVLLAIWRPSDDAWWG